MKLKLIKIIYYQLILILWFGLPVKAQKLPNVQQMGVRAPANIKIDGKATELNNQFQAYNHATDVYYTMTNDDNNLYLIIQATDIKIARKIVNGGITVTINPSGKKVDNNKIAITYPIYDKKERPTIRTARDLQVLSNTQLSDKEVDSLMQTNDKKVRDMAKNIRVIGIKAIDTLISIYNEDGIKASSGIGPQMAYTYELAISLKQLGLNINKPTAFAYNIKLNEVEMHGFEIKKDDNGIASINVTAGAQVGQPATDFWGEYTLIK